MKIRTPAIKKTKNIIIAITRRGKMKLCGASSSLSMMFVKQSDSNTFVQALGNNCLFDRTWELATDSQPGLRSKRKSIEGCQPQSRPCPETTRIVEQKYTQPG